MTNIFTPKERRELAAIAGINEHYLWQCLTGRRDMGPAEARRVEAATAGKITRQMVCQRTWLGIWPELAGISREVEHDPAPGAVVANNQPNVMEAA